jgi:hypothetical protein
LYQIRGVKENLVPGTSQEDVKIRNLMGYYMSIITIYTCFIWTIMLLIPTGQMIDQINFIKGYLFGMFFLALAKFHSSGLITPSSDSTLPFQEGVIEAFRIFLLINSIIIL